MVREVQSHTCKCDPYLPKKFEVKATLSPSPRPAYLNDTYKLIIIADIFLVYVIFPSGISGRRGFIYINWLSTISTTIYP